MERKSFYLMVQPLIGKGVGSFPTTKLLIFKFNISTKHFFQELYFIFWQLFITAKKLLKNFLTVFFPKYGRYFYSTAGDLLYFKWKFVYSQLAINYEFKEDRCRRNIFGAHSFLIALQTLTWTLIIKKQSFTKNKCFFSGRTIKRGRGLNPWTA